MTLLQLQEVCSDDLLAQPVEIKCGCCGEIIRPDGYDVDLPMCQMCYGRMVAEFRRGQRAKLTQQVVPG
jgi:hypothetical protein